jgi:hypothetical protein
MKHQGLALHRLGENPLEKRFADKWDQLQNRGHILDYLLSPTNRLEDSTTTQRDETIAATIIQWLGSPVGQSFIEDVMNIEKETQYRVFDKERGKYWPETFTLLELAKSQRFPSNAENFYEISELE